MEFMQIQSIILNACDVAAEKNHSSVVAYLGEMEQQGLFWRTLLSY
jgi:hypothetical protein